MGEYSEFLALKQQQIWKIDSVMNHILLKIYTHEIIYSLRLTLCHVCVECP